MSPLAFRWSAIGLTLLFAVVVWLRTEPESFGTTHDDTLYFSSAKAVAEGRGYVLPSVPGEPEQTKYPFLYPWLLSLVWRLWPEFPANLAAARMLNLALGCLMVAAAIGVLRRLGCGRGETLALGGIFALHPYSVFWTTQILSDIPFAAVTLGAALLGDQALRDEAGGRFWPRWLFAVALAWAALYFRTVGVAVGGGLALAALLARRPAACVVAASCALPVLAKVLGSSPAAQAAAGGPSGYAQTMLYYTDYVGFWKLCVPTFEAFQAQFLVMLTETLKHPGVAVFFVPAAGPAQPILQASTIALSIGVLKGAYSRAQQDGWQAYHWMFLLQLPVTLMWNFALMERFWIPFTPLLLAGASFEFQGVARAVADTVRSAKPMAEKVISVAIAAVLCGLIGYGGYRFAWDLPDLMERTMQRRVDHASAKREAWTWLRERADPTIRVVSYEDGLVYLNAGLQGMRPMSFSTEALFRQNEDILDHDLDRLTDVPAAIGARYWLAAPDDFAYEGADKQIREYVEELLSGWPEAFRSSDGLVALYRIPSETAAAK